MGLDGVALSTSAPSTAPVEAECAGVGPSLQELIQFVHQAVAPLKGSEESTVVAAAVLKSAPDVQRVRLHNAIEGACCVFLAVPDSSRVHQPVRRTPVDIVASVLTIPDVPYLSVVYSKSRATLLTISVVLEKSYLCMPLFVLGGACLCLWGGAEGATPGYHA